MGSATWEIQERHSHFGQGQCEHDFCTTDDCLTRDPWSDWSADGIGSDNEFATEAEALGAIEALQALGGEWAASEYRVVSIEWAASEYRVVSISDAIRQV